MLGKVSVATQIRPTDIYDYV